MNMFPNPKTPGPFGIESIEASLLQRLMKDVVKDRDLTHRKCLCGKDSRFSMQSYTEGNVMRIVSTIKCEIYTKCECGIVISTGIDLSKALSFDPQMFYTSIKIPVEEDVLKLYMDWNYCVMRDDFDHDPFVGSFVFPPGSIFIPGRCEDDK